MTFLFLHGHRMIEVSAASNPSNRKLSAPSLASAPPCRPAASSISAALAVLPRTRAWMVTAAFASTDALAWIRMTPPVSTLSRSTSSPPAHTPEILWPFGYVSKPRPSFLPRLYSPSYVSPSGQQYRPVPSFSPFLNSPS